MDTIKDGQYFKDLSDNTLTHKTIDELQLIFSKNKMKLENIPDGLISKKPVITEKLTRLPLFVYQGKKSWEGLVVCFPGTKKDLSTQNVSTPYLRHILYPIIDLQQRLREYYKKSMPCIYVIGDRFNDVFLRKFRLLKINTPHVIILTGDLQKCINKPPELPKEGKKNTENRIKYLLCKMSSEGNLKIPTDNGTDIDFRYICNELPAFEGTQNPERLDILGYDKIDKSLAAFEIKKPDTKDRVDLENLFLQGLEHLNWLEDNKMTIKFMFEGPAGNKINTRKRVKLVLGFGGENPPELFEEFRKAKQKDRYFEVVFCKLDSDYNKSVSLSRFGDKNK